MYLFEGITPSMCRDIQAANVHLLRLDRAPIGYFWRQRVSLLNGLTGIPWQDWGIPYQSQMDRCCRASIPDHQHLAND